MSLIMRPTGLGSGVDKDIFDYSVLSGDWPIGRIYERRGFSPDIRWEWSVRDVARPIGAFQMPLQMRGRPRRVPDQDLVE